MLPATGESPEIRGTVWYRVTRVKGDGGASGIIGLGRGDQAGRPASLLGECVSDSSSQGISALRWKVR